MKGCKCHDGWEHETRLRRGNEYKAVLVAHGRALNRHAPNWTAHLDTLEHWLQHELSRPRDYIGTSGAGKGCDT